MARGEKFCTSCKSRNGPRAYHCVSCGVGFVVKGIKQPNIAIGSVKQSSTTLLDKTKRSLAKYIVKLHDSIIVKGDCKKAWKSLNSGFHIEYRPKYDGVSMSAYGHYVLCGSKHRERHQSLKKAVHEMVKKEKKLGLHIRQK